MSAFTGAVQHSVATVRAATEGFRRVSASEAASMEREVLISTGLGGEAATVAAHRLATATAEFAAACVTANHTAKALAAALAAIEELARE